MDKEVITERISDLYVFLALEEKRRVDTFDLKCAIEAVAKIFGYRDLQLKAGFEKPVMTEYEAVERMQQTFQDYKKFLNFQTKTDN